MIGIVRKVLFEKVSIITDNNPTSYICQLSKGDIKNLEEILLSSLNELVTKCVLSKEDFPQVFKESMNGRLCDLEDLLIIKYI